MEKFEHLSKDTINSIASGLKTCLTASELANEVHFDVSGIIKHIKKYRILKETEVTNKCGVKYSCTKTNICTSCYRANAFNPSPKCLSCKANCNNVCNEYTPIPDCKRIKKFPYVCNGCEKYLHCHLNHYLYDAENVWNEVRKNRVEPRKGWHLSNEDFIAISNLLKPLIKDLHQSLPQIYLTHKEQIGVSYPTLLKYIDLGLIPGIKNIDLTKRVVYPKKYKKRKSEPTNAAFLKNRTYDDFVTYISENVGCNIVEMDTVLSSRDGNSCLLTLLFRKSNFMLAFKLKNKTSEEVRKVFLNFQKILGPELYRKTFEVILTDNGSEFANPLDIEIFDDTGEKLVNVYYCDPGKSGQKGKIEKNHVELRKIFPKPTNFDYFSQQQINIALCHINSEPRAILNGNAPGEIAHIWLNEKVLATNEYHFVERDKVFLHPTLLK